VRVLLAYAPHRDTFGYSMPPPGLLRLGGELRRRGIDVALEDLAYRLAAGEVPGDDGLVDACAGLLLRRAPDVLGLSTMGATLPAALAIAARVRRLAPRVPVLLGGPGTTGLDRALIERFPAIDAVVRGEGEQTLPELLGRLAEGREPSGIAGVTWRDARGRARVELDRAPLDLGLVADYARDLLPPLTAYKALTGEVEGLTPIDSGRGCVYDCSFCTIGRFWGRRSRTLPVERLVAEVAALRALPGARNAYLCHDIFGADRRHALAFCARMTQLAVDVPWECRARVDHLDEELLAAMAGAGCYRVLLGVESADQRVRALCDKRVDPALDMLARIESCARHGITPILSLILGLPGEDEAALAATLDLCAEASLRVGVNLSLHLVNPQPGCGLGEEFGASARPIEGIPPDMALGAGLTAPERALIEAHPDLFTTWCLLPLGEERLRDLASIARELPEVLMRYPKSFALMGRHLGSTSALSTYRAWRAAGRSFEGFVLAAGDGWSRAALRWEQGLVRAAARGARPVGVPLADAEDALPIAAVELVELDHDVPQALTALRAGQPLPLERSAILLALGRTPNGVSSERVTPDVAAILDLLAQPAHGGRTLAGLDATTPGLGRALRHLARAGLVDLLPLASGSTDLDPLNEPEHPPPSPPGAQP
jgi:radical SAM superfamily enzyme YgiQ (UPF0313 family)